MIWLGTGACLLTWAALAGVHRWRGDWLSLVAAAVLLFALAVAAGMYDRQLLIVTGLAAIAGAAALRAVWALPPGAIRLCALSAGAAAVLFAVYGPADGLF